MVATKMDNTNSSNNNNRKKSANKTGHMKNKMKNRNKRVVCNMRAGIGAMFNPSQMLDNPGSMDFNEPDIVRTPPIVRPPIPPLPVSSNIINKSSLHNGHPHHINGHNNKNQRPNRRQQTQLRRRQGGWGCPPPNMPPVPPLLNQRPLPPGGPFRGPMPPPRMHPMGPPMPPMRPPMPLMPPPSAMNGRFGPRPPLPPLMGRPPMPLPRPPPLGLGPLPPPRPLIPRTNGVHQNGIGAVGGGGLGPMLRRRQGGWGCPPPNMPPVPPLLNQRPLPPGGPFRGPMPPPRMHPMGPPMPLMPPPSAMNGRFGPRPPLPPLMGRPPMPLPRPPPLGLGPLPPPRPLIPRTNGVHQNGIGAVGGGGLGPIVTIANNAVNKLTPSSSIIYSLDKHWVNDEVRAEYKKKEDLENKLKGNRNDELFAEFKVQRDKFVKMYEAARIEFIGKHPEQDVEKIMTESDKPEIQTNNNLNKTNTSSSTIATTTTPNNSNTSNTNNTAES